MVGLVILFLFKQQSANHLKIIMEAEHDASVENVFQYLAREMTLVSHLHLMQRVFHKLCNALMVIPRIFEIGLNRLKNTAK